MPAPDSAGRLSLQDRERYLDLVEPGRACRREMKFHIGVGLEPILVLLVGVEVAEDGVTPAVRKGHGDAVHEVEKLDTATALRMRRDNLSGGDFNIHRRGRPAAHETGR